MQYDQEKTWFFFDHAKDLWRYGTGLATNRVVSSTSTTNVWDTVYHGTLLVDGGMFLGSRLPGEFRNNILVVAARSYLNIYFAWKVSLGHEVQQ